MFIFIESVVIISAFSDSVSIDRGNCCPIKLISHDYTSYIKPHANKL